MKDSAFYYDGFHCKYFDFHGNICLLTNYNELYLKEFANNDPLIFFDFSEYSEEELKKMSDDELMDKYFDKALQHAMIDYNYLDYDDFVRDCCTSKEQEEQLHNSIMNQLDESLKSLKTICGEIMHREFDEGNNNVTEFHINPAIGFIENPAYF